MKSKYAGGIGVVAGLLIATVWFQYPHKTPPSDAYPYYCTPDGTVLITPSITRKSLYIAPVGGTAFPSAVYVSHPYKEGGVEVTDRYEGHGITVVESGKDVTISSSKTTVTCHPEMWQ